MRILALAMLAAVTALGTIEAQAARWGEKYFEGIEVVDQYGKSHVFYDDLIKDKVFTINFMYTTCQDTCPLASSRFAQLQDKFGSAMGRDYFFYSISVDPVTDTPKQLREYAKNFQAGKGWLFLTGDPAKIKRLRYKLGDRGKTLDEHRNGIIIGNGGTGEFARESILGDLASLEIALRGMNRNWASARRATRRLLTTGKKVHVNLGAHPGQALFNRLCKGCHTVGDGRKVGPDLAGVTERRDREWLRSFISAPDVMRARKDPIAIRLAKRFPTVRMPQIGVTKDDVGDLIQYIHYLETKHDRKAPLKTLYGLTTQAGVPLTAEALKDKPVAVFFGYTYCPSICPTTLMDWSNLLRGLGKDGDRLKVLFVSVDPERDTPKALADYLGSFDPRITALTGTPAHIARAARAFEAYYEKKKEAGSEGYTFDHTTNVYLVAPDGHVMGKTNLQTAEAIRKKMVASLLSAE